MLLAQGTHCLLVDDHALFADALSLLIAHRHPAVQLSVASGCPPHWNSCARSRASAWCCWT